MTLTEAIVKTGNIKKTIIRKKRIIDNACRKAKDIYPSKIKGNSYVIIVVLEDLEGEITTTVLLEDFLAAPTC